MHVHMLQAFEAYNGQVRQAIFFRCVLRATNWGSVMTGVVQELGTKILQDAHTLLGPWFLNPAFAVRTH